MLKRRADFIIGNKNDPYMQRWWLIPRNKYFNLYLHLILKSDDDRALHDHPWINVSVLLEGEYGEWLPPGRLRLRCAGDVVFRCPTQLHRLTVLPYREPVISLFITGPVVREWGFACPKGWVPWRKFVNVNNPGEVGPGCGET